MNLSTLPSAMIQETSCLTRSFWLEKGPFGEARLDEEADKNVKYSTEKINKNLLEGRGGS